MKKIQKLFTLIAIITVFALMLMVVGCNNNNGENSSSSKTENSRISTPSNEESSSSFEEQSSSSIEENSSSSDDGSSSSNDDESSSSSDDGSSSSNDDGSSSSSDNESSSSSDDESSSSSEEQNSSENNPSQGGNSAEVETDTESGIEYLLNADGESYSIFSIGSCQEVKIDLANTFNDKPVTGILEGAFSNNSNITTLFIPTSITKIEDGALNNMTALTRIYYHGTFSDWANVTYSKSANNAINSLTLYYYSASEPDDNFSTWNYWYYSGNTVKEWDVFSEPL